MIEVIDVVKTYGKGEAIFAALDNVSIKIPDGAVVAVVGKSGSGKSTLMHIMSGLDSPTSGQVLINGNDMKQMSKKKLDLFRSREMSFVFQSFFVRGNESCYNNVSLPLEVAQVPKNQRKAKVEKALASVELSEKLRSKAKDLSGGQKQRLAIARAIVNEPKILFADEPTGNLDSTTGATVEKMLFDYAKNNNATLIIVTHDHDLASKCQIQINLKDGKIESVTGAAEDAQKIAEAGEA